MRMPDGYQVTMDINFPWLDVSVVEETTVLFKR